MGKKIIISISCIFALILFIMWGLLINSKATDIEQTVKSKVSSNSIGELVVGEKNPNNYPYYIHAGWFEAEQHQPPPHAIPIYGGYQIYCIEKGGEIKYADATISYAEAKALEGKIYTRGCGQCANQPRKGEKTLPIYTEVNSGKLSPAFAYIVSGAPIGSFSLDKQYGLWNMAALGLDGGLMYNKGTEGSSSYDTVAPDYAEYDGLVRDKGLQPKDESVYNKGDDKVTVKVNSETQKYTIGPFKINYTNGIYGNTTFSGISNMVVLGYNKEGTLVKDDIKIEKFILKDKTTGIYGGSVTPEYFEPDKDLKIDETTQVYPAPGQQFQIVISNPNEGVSSDDNRYVVDIKVKVNFKYMLANGEYAKLRGVKYKIAYACNHSYNYHTHGKPPSPHYGCMTRCYLEEIPQQWIATMDAIRSIYEQEIILGDGEDIEIGLTMDLGGHVWKDGVAGKESIADGISNTDGENIDIPLKNVKVSLYEEDGTLAKLASNVNEENIEIMNRVNPTYTNDNGNYLFEGLDSMKKYYVVFEYNGQTYLPTEYMVGGNTYNSEEWKVNSKGIESNVTIFAGVEISRYNTESGYDARFQEIGSYPKNYPSSNNLGWAKDGYNISYTQKDLMGYILNDEGKYVQQNTQLIDGYLYDEKGLETTEFKEGIISQKIRKYIKDNKKFPNDDELKSIYSEIANGNEEIQSMLQFVEDCYIQSYTGSIETQEKTLYPVYKYFKINKTDDYDSYKTPEDYQNGNYNTNSETLDGIEYKALYPGQFFINQGLWRRQEFDAALRKDIYKATLKINDKTVIYNYDKRNEDNDDKVGTNNKEGNDNNTYWDINLRMSDYEKYYSSSYNEDGKPGYYREIYETDYVFNNGSGFGEGHKGDPLEIYITYKITVRNQSQSIMTEIKEVVDFYDKDYTYKPNLSWVMYQEGDNTNTSVDKNSYYEMMDQEQEVINDENTSAITFIKNAKGAKVAKDAKVDLENSKYGTVTHSDIAKENGKYQDLYVRGLENKKLATGESAYIYLTFQVNKENNKVILDGGKYATSDTPKENLTEINGYKTYYADNTKLPNEVDKTSENIAGLLDRDSNPGNLEAKDLEGDKYEKNFEDDTDRAPSLRVLIDEDAVRNANGTVWEDERNKEVDDSIIGDGIRAEDEIGVEGVTVQLVEKCNNGTEYIWYETTTVDDGKYGFDKEHLGDGYIGYIPGDYVIRFYYGDKQDTAIAGENGGLNETAYNGQDFKSTLYQTGINQEEATDIDGRYQGYVDTQNQNESVIYNAENGTGKKKVDAFVYDIYASDDAKENYSDAKDIWSRRNTVINYSAENVTNHKAEVLASPYSGDSSLYEELIENTYMIAETGMIVVEFEYDRQETDGIKDTVNDSSNSSQDYIGSDNEQEDNRRNSRYTLNNIDFGLVERPKAQLEIDKSVANVKVTLANGSILFDINKAANNAIWKDHEEYSIDEQKKISSTNEDDRSDDNLDNNNSVKKSDSYYNPNEGDSIGMYEEYYGVNALHRYAYRTVRNGIDDIVANTDRGLIQLTMDEELMHGATIQIEYTVKITNVGEIDYVDDDTKDFYYNGDKSGTTVVTTTANQVIDYVQNNLQFVNSAKGINDINTNYVADTNQQNGWGVIKPNDITGGDLVNNRLAEKLPKFNTIIQTGNFATDALVPGQETSRTLILTQMITPENEEDDLTYSNMVEIVKTSNTVGRRMAYSVVGNQDPLANDPAEVDTSMAEKIVILPPFGEVRMYYILGAIIAILLIGGIVLIKKKVLKGKD